MYATEAGCKLSASVSMEIFTHSNCLFPEITEKIKTNFRVKSSGKESITLKSL